MNRKDGEWTEEKNLAEKIKKFLVWNKSYNKRCMLLDKDIFTWMIQFY